MLADLVHDEHEKLFRERVALVDHGHAEFVKVNAVAAVLVHHEEGLKFVVQIAVQVEKLVERNLAVGVFVAARYQQLNSLYIKLVVGLAAS